MFVATMAPAFGSPAIDAGFDDVCPDLDPHGLIRPQGVHCDIGAYEVDNDPPDVILDSHPSDLTNSTSAEFTFTTMIMADPGLQLWNASLMEAVIAHAQALKVIIPWLKAITPSR